MGIETSGDHGGAECGFTSAIVVIEGKVMSLGDLCGMLADLPFLMV